MTGSLSTREAARIVGLSEAQIRDLLRSGLARASRESRRYALSFRDLVVLRAARELLDRRVPARRIRQALRALAAELPDDRPVSGLRIFARGTHVAVSDGRQHWDPLTGQTSFAFEVDALAQRTEEVRHARRHSAESTDVRGRALLEFERGLELESASPDLACGAYRRALEIDPGFVDANVNLGRLMHERGDAAGAIARYEEALALTPDDPVIHFNVALAREDLQGPEAAIVHYRRALELDPEFADAHFNLARVHEQLGQRLHALRHYHAYKKLTDP